MLETKPMQKYMFDATCINNTYITLPTKPTPTSKKFTPLLRLGVMLLPLNLRLPPTLPKATKP